MKSRSNQIFIEFKESSVHVLDGADGADFPLEREGNGKVAPGSRSTLANGLRGFLQRHGVLGQRQAICALPARGVTFRTITLPAGVKNDERRLLAMQIEAQFPVPPSELAWSYAKVSTHNGKSNGSAGTNGSANSGQSDFFVAAVRRDVVDDYASLLSSCGISPVFTVAALARAGATDESGGDGPGAFGILEVGTERSELIVYDQDNSVPSLRVINWGQKQTENLQPLRAALSADTASRLYVSSIHISPQVVVSSLSASIPAKVLPVPQGQGVTAATHGLRSLSGFDGLLLLGRSEESSEKRPLPKHWTWIAATALLLLCAFSLRYVEAVLFRSQLTSRLNELTRYRKTLPNLEREVSFLNFIKTNQPPYLDTVAVISSAAPPGTKLDQILVVRRGDVSLRGSVQDPQGPEKFRTKLIDSGFFSKVVVEEQGPASQQDRNKINFRIAAILKPDSARKILPPEPPLTNKTGKAGSSMPGSRSPGMPPNLPPGAVPMPMPMPPNG